MILMDLNNTITLITLIIGLIGAIAALIPTLIKLFNTIKEIAKNKNWTKLIAIAMDAMKDVEKHYRENPNMSSQEKLDMALDIIRSSSANLGVTISEKEIDDLVKYIEDTIKWANDMKK
jgi:uncharacterized membrane protein YbaN (DUF454 family)